MYTLLVVLSLIAAIAIYNGKTHSGSECERSVDVAIIGAGPAGSYFAYRLRDAGLNIELFEYSNRIGGRLFTTTLPNIPDVNLELGGMRYFEDVHVRVHRLVHELNLTPTEFAEGLGRKDRKKYFLRGKILNANDVRHGEVPYSLSSEEKRNQGDLALYYLEKLTGFNGTLTEKMALELKTRNGTELYKLTMDEAMGMVATPEGRQFLKDTALYDCAYNSDTSAVDYFLDQFNFYSHNGRILTVKEGMSSIPIYLVKTFLQSSRMHKLTTNRKLEAISQKESGFYRLHLHKTTTVDGLTTEQGSAETVCAKKVALAIPQFALTRIKWTPLRFTNVKDALFAVTPTRVNKVFLVFPETWWLSDAATPVSDVVSDASFRHMYNWKSSNVSGHFVMLASYADSDYTEYLESINSEQLSGTAAGPNKVTNRLKEILILHLGQAFGLGTSLIPEPTAAISQFWTSYPFGGGWTSWRAGYNVTDVLQTIQCPSSTEDVYIVGGDFSFVGSTTWTEGALKSVDQIYNKYFI